MRTAFIGLLLLLFGSGCGASGEYPSRPVTLICPWSVGGGTDRISRQIAAQLERELGVPVNVINASGGAGVTGHTRGALARPDGYTMTMITSELNMLHWRGLTNVTYREFHPLMRVNRDHAALFVRDDAPWSSIEELETAIRDRPGALKASGTAFGGIWHVALAGWLIHAGMSPDDVVWISLNGSAPSLQELMAGGVDVVSCSVPEARSLVDAGRVRCLTVMSDERLPSVPDVPTLQEYGSDWTSFTWRGLALPLDVPDERVAVLEQALRSVVTSDEFRQFCERAGFGWTADGSDEFRASLAQENDQFGEIFQSAAFQSVRRQTYGPWLFPSIVGVLLAIALAASVVAHHRRRPAEPDTGAAAANRFYMMLYGSATRHGLIACLGAVGGVILYILLAEPLGYVVTTALILFSLLLLLRVRLPVAAVTAVVFAAVSYHLFAVLLRVSLPWGILGW